VRELTGNGRSERSVSADLVVIGEYPLHQPMGQEGFDAGDQALVEPADYITVFRVFLFDYFPDGAGKDDRI
jgi:hypothetical protein